MSRSVCILSWNVVAFSLEVEIVLAVTDVMAGEHLGALSNDVALRADGMYIGYMAPGTRKLKMTRFARAD